MCLLLWLSLQPLMEAWFLCGTQLDAIIHAVDGLGESTLRGLDFMGGEEADDVIPLFDAAEVARCRDYTYP